MPGRLVRGTAMRLPFADGTFDAVVAVHVLHLVADVPGMLREASRVLRPGGRVVAIHGALDHPDHPDDELAWATRTLRDLWGDRPDSPDDVRAAGLACGLERVAQHPSSPQTARHTPAGLADLISRRVFSSLWDVDDDAWQRHVQPAIDALRALPDQDRPRPSRPARR